MIMTYDDRLRDCDSADLAPSSLKHHAATLGRVRLGFYAAKRMFLQTAGLPVLRPSYGGPLTPARPGRRVAAGRGLGAIGEARHTKTP